MSKRNKARNAFVACLISVVATIALAGTAFAADITIQGADYHGSGSVLKAGNVDVLNVDAPAGTTIFLTVTRSGVTVAQNLPYTVGADASPDDDSVWAGVATLEIDELSMATLNGAYTIDAYSDRAGKKLLYSGTLYGVYADLPDGQKLLIGTRTANASELSSRAFNPSEALYSNNHSYRLVGPADSTDGGLHFAYEEYDEATTVDGVIKYVDSDGNILTSTKVPGLAYGESKTIDVPSTIVADSGDLYRTVYFQNTVTFENPGKTSFTVYCTKVTESYHALANYYVATIQMVDADTGNIIATDTVDVTGNFRYTAPTSIYKTEYIDGKNVVVTYNINTTPSIFLSAATAKEDGVVNRARTIRVPYKAEPLDSAEVDVTFNLLDGTKRANEEGRTLQTMSVTVSDENPTAVPPEQVEANGSTYYLVGDPENYAYEAHSGKVPSVNAYYTPEGYTPPGPYDVTVNYVNFSTGEVVETHTYTSDPNATEALTIETPETFSANGIDYVRLDGQSEPIEHSYYSGIGSYTIYYRDKNDVLTSGTVINTIRVVYTDVPAADAAGATAVAGQPGAVAVGAEGDAATTGAAIAGATTTGLDSAAALAVGADDAARSLQLNGGRTYNVFDGVGNNGSLTNEAGINSNTERIEDNETPLSSGYDKGATSSAASVFGRLTTIALPIGIVVVIAAIVGLVVMRRRANRDPYED